MFDVIAAVATAPGASGVAIVRVSGYGSFSVTKKMVSLMGLDGNLIKDNGEAFDALEPRYLARAAFLGAKGELLDEGLVVKFVGPNSFTGEDIVEIHCHGGIAAPRAILSALIEAGARQAEAGEFTRRAFLNGRMDLSRAEAVSDIIEAKTEQSLKLAAGQLSGELERRINAARERILGAAAHLAAEIDFPEEGVEEISRGELVEVICGAKEELSTLIKTASGGKVITGGFRVPILGAPNVGKSSLLNAILGEDRAIVTGIAGTTRDVVEAGANIGGFYVNLMDTAGIRETQDEVEREGVVRAKKLAWDADFVLVVLDSSRELGAEDREILAMTDETERFIVWNKSDLCSNRKAHSIGSRKGKDVFLSAKTGEGLEDLLKGIEELCRSKVPSETGVVTNSRQENALIRARGFLSEAEKTAGDSGVTDLILGDLELAIEALGEVTGQTVREEIIDEVFSRFCVGK